MVGAVNTDLMTRARLAKGLSTKDLAEAVGERGEQDPRLDVAARLAHALGITIEQLAGRVAAPEVVATRPPQVTVDGVPYRPADAPAAPDPAAEVARDIAESDEKRQGPRDRRRGRR